MHGCTGGVARYEIFNEIFQGKNITYLDINKWDLNNKLDRVYDLIIINNVLMYCNNPHKCLIIYLILVNF